MEDIDANPNNGTQVVQAIQETGLFTYDFNLVFSGGRDGYFVALDARNGAPLWKAPVGGQINAGAMSYSVNGKQYVAIAAGNALFSYALP